MQQFMSALVAQRRLALALACALALLACGDDNDGKDSPAGEPPTLKASQGACEGSLTLEPWPAVVGDNQVELELTDADGEPLEGATVEIQPWMPAHGHGSKEVSAREGEPGHYATDKLYLNMPGLWELRIHVTRDGEEGRLVASFEVP